MAEQVTVDRRLTPIAMANGARHAFLVSNCTPPVNGLTNVS